MGLIFTIIDLLPILLLVIGKFVKPDGFYDQGNLFFNKSHCAFYQNNAKKKIQINFPLHIN